MMTAVPASGFGTQRTPDRSTGDLPTQQVGDGPYSTADSGAELTTGIYICYQQKITTVSMPPPTGCG